MSGPEWFRSWFGEEYVRLYPHRDDEEAARAVSLVLSAAPLPAGASALDLGCGAGRHLHHLAAAGLCPVGLDLSWTLLGRAREAGRPLVRADMRALPFAPRSFALVTSFFTSFGYFEGPGQDRRVLEEVARVLGRGGVLALDYLNAAAVRSNLRERDERVVEGRRVVQTRAIVKGGSRVEKRIEIEEPGGPPRVFHESVRLYEPREIASLLAGAGLAVRHIFGDYRGAAQDDDSPRAIFLAELP